MIPWCLMIVQLENVCFDTEVMDNDDLGNMEDVKVEPELKLYLDEGRCRTKAEIFLDGSKTTARSGRKVAEKREVGSPCLDAVTTIKQFGAGKKGSSINLASSDGKKYVPQLSVGNHEIGKLEYVNSEEPEESSQANAFCFVNFLTVNNMDMCQGVEERMSARKKSPLVSSAKGTQQADSFSKRITTSSEFGDFWQRTDKRHKNLQGQRSLSNEHEEKKEFADLREDIRGPSHSHSSFTDQGSKVSIRIEQEPERNLINGFVKELDKFVQTESSWEKFEASDTARDIPDTFDVGISTQTAAEAMEALYYGLPPGCKADDTCEGLANTLTDLPEGE
ncbi:hypothetical protein REPUB_Repub17cG0103800 [Reevesia pubescens]